MPTPPPFDQPSASPPLPPILEVKRTLAGGEKRFECRVLHTEGAHLVVLFVSRQPMHVHGVALPSGTITLGHFWSDRPYNVYDWLDGKNGQPLGSYVNLSAETRIQPARLEWLDLVVDVLVLPGRAPRVLDEDEIPPDAPAFQRAQIADARAVVLDGWPALCDELAAFREQLGPRAQTEAARAP